MLIRDQVHHLHKVSDLVVGWRCLAVGRMKHQGGSGSVEALAK